MQREWTGMTKRVLTRTKRVSSYFERTYFLNGPFIKCYNLEDGLLNWHGFACCR